MGRSFFYTVSSLPTLRFEAKPPVSRKEFLYSCSLELKGKEMEQITGSTIGVPVSDTALNGLSLTFWKWNRSLKNTLAVHRGKMLDVDSSDFIREGEDVLGTEAVAASAVKISSPLEAELFLMKARWDFLESLKSGHLFDLAFLIIYSLQLEILERKELFEESRGFEVYQDLYRKILENTDNDITIGV